MLSFVVGQLEVAGVLEGDCGDASVELVALLLTSGRNIPRLKP